jgi:cytosolic carboxypeptidase protein 2/3
VSINEYNLYLSVDTNTKTQTQWFYFAVSNTEEGRSIKFNILNLTKPCTLFKNGMRPISFSEVEYESERIGWIRDTSNVYLSRNKLLMKYEGIDKKEKQFSGFYSYAFSYTFKHTNDRVYFALYKPYSNYFLCQAPILK